VLSDAHAREEWLDDRFRLEVRLGSGTFASVWRAHDVTTGQDVALKILYDRFRSDKKVMQRFAQEAKLLMRLIHPHIARAIAFSVECDYAYVAMEHVRGVTLAHRLTENAARERQFPVRSVSWLCDRLCAAVSYAHAHGVIHRDLKPTNVMINEQKAAPFLKVLDFGIAKVIGSADVDPTTGGRVLGSILYLAPEQIQKGTYDPRSDVFAIACMLFEFLTLRRAWARGLDGRPLRFDQPLDVAAANNQFAVLHRIARDERPRASASRPDVPALVDEVLIKGMAVEPEERWSTPAELALALRDALTPERARPAEEQATPRDPLGMLETLPEIRAFRG
jgi:eukaryotic-like serine/threonine-protein kinase